MSQMRVHMHAMHVCMFVCWCTLRLTRMSRSRRLCAPPHRVAFANIECGGVVSVVHSLLRFLRGYAMMTRDVGEGYCPLLCECHACVRLQLLRPIYISNNNNYARMRTTVAILAPALCTYAYLLHSYMHTCIDACLERWRTFAVHNSWYAFVAYLGLHFCSVSNVHSIRNKCVIMCGEGRARRNFPFSNVFHILHRLWHTLPFTRRRAGCHLLVQPPFCYRKVLTQIYGMFRCMYYITSAYSSTTDRVVFFCNTYEPQETLYICATCVSSR